MLATELIELAKKVIHQQAETQTIEVKTAHEDCPKRLYDTLSSFSNQDTGGIILFGLNENKKFAVEGVYDLQDLQKQVTHQCLQMEPPVRAVFTFAELEGKDICSAEIPGIDLAERPCYYTGRGRLKGAFIRVGDADLTMTEYELYSYEAFRKHVHDDERIIERATLDSLEANMVEQYIFDKQKDRPRFAQLPLGTTYEMLNILRDGKPTFAAVFNFGLYPQGYFPQLGITAIVVPGTEIGVTDEHDTRFLDNKRIEGNIKSMVAEALSFCMRNMKTRTVIDSKTGQRTDQTEYPITALREAILNALIHRDYSMYTEATPIQLNIFTNRIEIHSPGSLYGRMTVDQLGIARPDLRNPALAVMAETLTEAENRYSGIPTMRREMKKYGLREPVFENRRNEFVVTFYNTKDEEGTIVPEDTTDMVNRILAYCKTPRTRSELTEFVGIKTFFYVQKKYLKALIDQGKIKLTNPDKPRSRNQRFYSVDS